MKRLALIILLLLLSILLYGCGNNNSSEDKNDSDTQETEETDKDIETYNLGQTIDCDFGTFSITGFKREGETLYFSIQINPKNSGTNTVNLDNMKYYTGLTPYDTSIKDIKLTGTPYQGVYTINSDKVGAISAISLDYNGVKGKWTIDINANSAGDVNLIDTTIAQIKAQQEQQRAQQEQQRIQQEQARAAQEEKNNVAYAWQVVDEYGEAMYPYGFKLHYIMDKLAEEKQSDGTWFLKAGCDVTNMYNAKMSGVCEAVVQGSGQNWTVVSFNVY